MEVSEIRIYITGIMYIVLEVLIRLSILFLPIKILPIEKIMNSIDFKYLNEPGAREVLLFAIIVIWCFISRELSNTVLRYIDNKLNGGRKNDN